jgi:protein O-mannosyl-transferase
MPKKPPITKVKERPPLDKRWIWLVISVLVLATIGVYIRGIWNGFVDYDDNDYVTNNRNVRVGLTENSVKWAFSTSFTANNYHPLTWLSHQADVTVFGLNAAGHHMVSLALHLANTLLLLWFLYYTTRRFWVASIVAALFALHPLHVESVAWVAERKDVLSTFFWLATMLAYAWYVKKRTDEGRWSSGLPAYVLAILLFAIGLLAKPMLVTLPLVLVLLDYWPLNRFNLEPRNLLGADNRRAVLRSLLDKVPFAILAALSATITVRAQQTAMPAWELMDWPMRITNTALSYWRYVISMVWPFGLAPFYPHPHEAFWGRAIVCYALLIAATVLAIYYGTRERKYLLVGWLWYLGTLVPVIGMVQVGDQSHADRYTYVPLIGLLVMIAWFLGDACRKKAELVRPAATITLIVIAALAAVSFRQVGFWKDDITLFSRTVRVTENNYVMLTNLGVAYSTKDDLDRAADSFSKSLAIRPNEAYTHHGLGVVLLKKKDFLGAIECFKRAIELKPEFKEAYMHSAKAYLTIGKPAEAVTYAQKVVELDPEWPDAHVQLAASLCEAGQIDKAEEECRVALKLNPRLAMAHFTLAGVYVKRGDFEHAAEQYRQSISIEPDFSAWNNLGNTLLHLNNLKEAEASYRESIRLNPLRADAFFNMGIALAGQDRKAEAIAAVKQALVLSPQNPEIQKYLTTLQNGQ